MTGGFLQLVAKNYDDLYLTITPQVTMFKVVYRRYTNFSIYDDDILIKSGGNFSSKTIVKLDNKADLLHKMYVVAELPQVKITKKKPTFDSIQKLLATYGVTWNYSAFGLANDSVTFESYDSSGGVTSISNTINNRIKFLIENYNFFNNGTMMANDGTTSSSSTGAIVTSITNSLVRLQDSSGSFLATSKPNNYNEIQTTLINGRTCATELLYKMTSSYVPDYGNTNRPILSSKLLTSNLPTQTLTYPSSKTLSLYNQGTEKILLENGVLLGALKAYSKDALIYNANYAYNNSGFITSGYLPNITSSGTGTFYRKVLFKVTITNATISGTSITGGSISGTFVDPMMSAYSSPISGINIINATISTTAGSLYTNYSILNCTITLTSTMLNSRTISGSITSGILTPSTISGITITNAVFSNSMVTGGNFTAIASQVASNMANDGTILLPNVTIVDSNNVKRIKTLYNCTFSGGAFTKNVTANRTITSGTEATIVITDAQLTGATITGSVISGGTITNGLLVNNNVTIPLTVTNVVLVNAAVKSTQTKTETQKIKIAGIVVKTIRRTITVVVTTLYNMSHVTLTNITMSGSKISSAQITAGTIHPNSMSGTVILNAVSNTQTLTSGTISGGTMYNYAIPDIGIATGVLPSAFLTNATLIDAGGVSYSIVELDNLNLSYPSNITNVTITGNTTNPVYIPDVAINSYDNTRSSPLFGNILKRPGVYTDTAGTSTIYLNDSPAIIRLPLYNSDDFRYITYMTYLNNITRIKITTTGTTDPFNPTYSSVSQQNLTISSQNLNILTPQLLSLDESILFYHVVDPAITKYNVYPYNVGHSTSSYFDDIVQSTYNIVNKYNQVIPVARDQYTDSDAYMIYRQYFQSISTDSIYNTVTSSDQIQYIANLLIANININIKYNFAQLSQILLVLYNGYRNIGSSYIITFHKKFTYSNTTQKYTNSSGLSFTAITDNTSGLNDNFLSVLNDVRPLPYSGVDVTNFFNGYVNSQFDSFIFLCQSYLAESGYSEYHNDYDMWDRNLYKNGGQLRTLYSLVTNGLYLPNQLTYGKISVSAYMPFLAARDIPQMMYDTFSTYADQIFGPFLDPSYSTTHPDYITVRNNFIGEFYKFTDTETDAGIPTMIGHPFYGIDGTAYYASITKKKIYERIIYLTFLSTNYKTSASSSTTSATPQFLNDSYFGTLQNLQAKNNDYLLAFTFRPDSFTYPSSTQDTDGTLKDLNLAGNQFNTGTDMKDMVYLPIEWLTQTYYNILGKATDAYIDSTSFMWASTDTKSPYLLKQTIRGILANIVNCFIATTTLPSLTNYKNNRYTLLGLLPETKSVFSDNTNSTIVTTSSSLLYSDAISSITYQTQKKFIQFYNRLFNDSILSQNYYRTNLGTAMTSLYNYIATQFTLVNSTNIKYDTSTTYQNRTPGTLSFANDFDGYMDSSGYIQNLTTYPISNWTTEVYPAIDSEGGDVGFDIYRLSSLPNTITTITTFISDFNILYDYMLAQYNQNKTILQLKNDTSSLTINGIFEDGTPDYSNTSTLKKTDFQYGQSQSINNYLYSNVYTKYIYPITSASIKSTLDTLALNTMNYWIPQFDTSGTLTNNGLLGALDLLYGTLDTSGNSYPYDSSGNIDYSGIIKFPSGNIPYELNKLKTIPAGKVASDFIDLSSVSNNPFKSFFLHDWYLSLKTTNNLIMDSSGNFITYQTLINAVDIFNDAIGSTENQLITSSSLASNPYISTLYTSKIGFVEGDPTKQGNIFGDASVIADMLFDNIFRNIVSYITNGTFEAGTIASQISALQSNNGYNQTLNALKSTFSRALPAMGIALSKLTKFTDPNILTTTYNGNHQYIDITQTRPPSDVYYYYSSQTSDLINTGLETVVLEAIEFKPAKFAWVKELGIKLIKNISIKIGGQLIDSHSSELSHFINKIYRNSNQHRGYNIMVGNVPELYEYSDVQRLQNKLYIPINLWFTKHAGNALPLLCLLYSDVELIIEMSNYSDVLSIEESSYFTKIPKLKTKLFAQYIYLDEEERHRMAQSKLEYLIESYNHSGLKIYSSKNLFSQTDAQIISKNKGYVAQDILKGKQLSPIIKYNIYMNDPVKYLIWYVKIIDKKTQHPLDMLDWNKFGYRVRDSSGNMVEFSTIFSSISLQMNGANREDPKNEDYYTYVSPHSKGIPGIKTGEYFYSFALYPTLLQPSGSANYSELIDSSVTMVLTDYVLELIKNNPNIEIQTELWGCANKILRVMSGFGALAFYK